MAQYGFGIEGGHLKVWDNDRVVFTTAGKLVNLLPTVHTFSETLSYSNPTFDTIYAWAASQDWVVSGGPDGYSQVNTGQTFFTAVPEEVEVAQDLIDAPDGADCFWGRVTLTRTVAPTHTWCGSTIIPLIKEGKSIPWNGSGKIEAGFGLTRLMHLVIEGGKLKLIAQQSIGSYCGGADHSFGNYPNLFPAFQDRSGGIFQKGSQDGLVVWSSTSSPYRKSSNRSGNTDSPLGLGSYTTHQRTGSDPCSTTPPMNYSSQYSVSITGKFGRSQ